MFIFYLLLKSYIRFIFHLLKLLFVSTDVPASIAKRKMKKILNSKQYQKKDIINSIEEYIQNEDSFVKMLDNMELSIDNRGLGALNRVSLARILLEITEIQADVYNIFISKLNESVLLA